MDIFQRMFEKEIEDSLAFPEVAIKLIRRQFELKGVLLSENQIAALRIELHNFNDEIANLNFDLDDDQRDILGIPDGEEIVIDISGEEELDEIYQEISESIVRMIPEIVEEMTVQILSALRKDMLAMLRANRKQRRGFEKRLHHDWKVPFDLLEAFIYLSIEAGDDFNKSYQDGKTEVVNHVFEALIRLHARACQIASEILALLKSGFADGAHARWRSLHEIAVVASFINVHGDETAERYLLHDNIESYKAAILHQKHCDALGVEPIPQDEMDFIKTVRDELMERFGSSYKNNYGWASFALNRDDPKFSDIEENSGLDHLRPYYKLASHNVHANPKGAMFRLGLTKHTQHILLAGPSNTGFTDPAHGTAISLGVITITLLTTNPTIDSLIMSNAILRLESEIGDEFLRVQIEIEDRDTVNDS